MVIAGDYCVSNSNWLVLFRQGWEIIIQLKAVKLNIVENCNDLVKSGILTKDYAFGPVETFEIKFGVYRD